MGVAKYSEFDKYGKYDVDDIMVSYTDLYDVSYKYRKLNGYIEMYIYFKKNDPDENFRPQYSDRHINIIRLASDIVNDMKKRTGVDLERSGLIDLRYSSVPKFLDMSKYVTCFKIELPLSNFTSNR